jgi:hypothetical protein
MNPPSDELRQLWQSGPGNGGINQSELLRQLEQKTRKFDRMIRFRDLRESVAGLVITVVYGWFALHAGSMLERVADLWLAACGVWIAVFLWRFSRLARKPAPDQSLAVYRHELVERYNKQIQLSKSVKYWYILPFWAGVMLSEAAHLMNGLSKTRVLIVVVFVTLCSAFVWWLNEGPGVRYLERKRSELEDLIGEKGVSK